MSKNALKDFYNYHQQYGALSSDLLETQYGFKDGQIKDPTRYYLFYQELLNLITEKVSGRAVLADIGCGMGILAERIHNKVSRYVGMDLSLERIKQAKGKIIYANCFFVVGDAQDLPFKQGIFTQVVAIEVIEHLPQTQFFLRGVAGILEKGGDFIISTPANLFFENNLEQLGKDQHLYEFSPAKLKQLLKKEGFTVNALTGVGFKLPKIKIPLWLGNDFIKRVYAKLKHVELKKGYGHSICFQFDMASNPFFNKLYLYLPKGLWVKLIRFFGFMGRHMPVFSSNMVAVCRK